MGGSHPHAGRTTPVAVVATHKSVSSEGSVNPPPSANSDQDDAQQPEAPAGAPRIAGVSQNSAPADNAGPSGQGTQLDQTEGSDPTTPTDQGTQPDQTEGSEPTPFSR
jgi:hypothetical protein